MSGKPVHGPQSTVHGKARCTLALDGLPLTNCGLWTVDRGLLNCSFSINCTVK